MDPPAPDSLPRERNLILGLLIGLAAAAWAWLIWQAGRLEPMAMGLTMGLGPPLFLAVWVTMMVAMMFPTAAPMILMFTRIHAGRRHTNAFVPTWVFVAGYLVVWTAAGGVAFLIAAVAEGLAESVPGLRDNAGRIGGAILVLAGVYQLSPLKEACLAKCRTPIGFLMTAWRDGHGGAFRMGLEHGAYCLGCCWLLFLILFPLGLMNIAAMAVVTALIFAEKSIPAGRIIGRVAAICLIVYGLAALIAPALLPTQWQPMPAGEPIGPTDPLPPTGPHPSEGPMRDGGMPGMKGM